MLQDKYDGELSLNEFRAYMVEKEYGDESLQFYFAAEKYKQAVQDLSEEDPTQAQELMKEILEKHMKQGAEFEINISGTLRTNTIRQCFECTQDGKCPPNLLDAPQAEIERLMQRNTLPRFVDYKAINVNQEGLNEKRRNTIYLSVFSLALVIPLILSSLSRYYRLFSVVPLFLLINLLFQVTTRIWVSTATKALANNPKSLLARISQRKALIGVMKTFLIAVVVVVGIVAIPEVGLF